MSVLNRKLFNRGGKVSSRGVGITSGLIDQPVQKFQSGGSVSKAEALTPALLDLSAGNEVTVSLYQNAGDGSGANGDGTVPKSFFMGYKIGA